MNENPSVDTPASRGDSTSVRVAVVNIRPVLVRVFEGLVLVTVGVLPGDRLRMNVSVVTIVVPMSVFVFDLLVVVSV